MERYISNYQNIEVELQVELGSAMRKLDDILTWRRGSVITLENSTVNQLDVKIEGKKIGEGNIYRNEKSEMDLKITKINNKNI